MTLVVPWNAAWSGEEVFEVRPCRWVNGRRALWQKFAPGTGRPLFASPHFVRQRRSVAQFLCTVCGAPTPVNDRWWFQHGEFREGYLMTAEAPVHHACGETARELCPHLKSKVDIFEPFPMKGLVRLGALITSKDDLERHGLKIGPEDRVIGTLKFAWPEEIVRRK